MRARPRESGDPQAAVGGSNDSAGLARPVDVTVEPGTGGGEPGVDLTVGSDAKGEQPSVLVVGESEHLPPDDDDLAVGLTDRRGGHGTGADRVNDLAT